MHLCHMRYWILMSFLGLSFLGYGQIIFPGQTGDNLLHSLRVEYTTQTVLTYGEARDTMYAKIDNVNDTVYGIYSQHGIYLPPNEDPTTFLFMNGIQNAINCEHSYPRSRGATTGSMAASDMHHLFPSRLAVNEARGSSPFGEIPDSQTSNWYLEDDTQNNIPSAAVRDLYSEQTSSRFEPRESVKGDIARAMFYFYTIYRNQADAADPNFFESMRPAICQWHYDDPISQKELDRSAFIALYQDGKENPFVLDCTLPKRCYCDDVMRACFVSTDYVKNTELSYTVENEVIYFDLKEGQEIQQAHVFNLLGQKLQMINNPGDQLELSRTGFAVKLVQILFEENNQLHSHIIKINSIKE